MTHNQAQDRLTEYELGSLDEATRRELEIYLETDPVMQAELQDLQAVLDDLLWLPEPQTLPEGHLDRLRQKAGVAGDDVPAGATLPEGHLERLRSKAGVQVEQVSPPPGNVTSADTLERARARRAGRSNPNWLAWGSMAAAVVLLVIAGVLGFLLADANRQLDAAKNNQSPDVIALVGSGNLKVTDLAAQPDDKGAGVARLVANPATNKAVLVVQNWGNLPSNKEYQVWLLDASGKPYGVGLFEPNSEVVNLNVPGNIAQFGTVAVTAEPKGGSPAPTLPIISAGKIS